MSMNIEKLARRVAALERRLASEDATDEDQGEVKEASERMTLAAEITALERKLKADDMLPSLDLEDVDPMTAADEDEDEKTASDEDEDEKTASDDEEDEKTASDDEEDEKTASDDDDDEKTASLVDPDGVEERITQKYLTEVQDLQHGTELATGKSMLDVAPTEYVARLKNASERLDAVANYLEKHGRTAMALRLDKIADSIDARVAKFVRR